VPSHLRGSGANAGSAHRKAKRPFACASGGGRWNSRRQAAPPRLCRSMVHTRTRRGRCPRGNMFDRNDGDDRPIRRPRPPRGLGGDASELVCSRSVPRSNPRDIDRRPPRRLVGSVMDARRSASFEALSQVLTTPRRSRGRAVQVLTTRWQRRGRAVHAVAAPRSGRSGVDHAVTAPPTCRRGGPSDARTDDRKDHLTPA